MRETHYNNELKEYTCDYFHDENAGHRAIQKLGQHEDIEDDLGIELITLFKVCSYHKNKETVYCYYKGHIVEGKIRTIIMKNNEINIIDNCLIFHLCKFKDYGKTWALTKEELKCNSLEQKTEE